ncbi:hypothetical protein KY284_000672 [Solanum tuberosum]|nr:hypothetical protein KY284_000672 [Solanum tuberosum]
MGRTLRELSLCNVPSVGDEGLFEISHGCHLSLVGRKVTIVKLVAIAVGTSNRGGLTKLSIRGNNLCHGVTYIGLKDISRGSPTLREHSLWNVSVGDEGLSEIAHECHLLEKLDLFQCPRNRGLEGSTSLEHRSSDAVNECRMMNSSTTNPCDPNLVPSWKSERYIALVDFMRSKDLVMRTLINDVELLILASTTLCSDFQSIQKNLIV